MKVEGCIKYRMYKFCDYLRANYSVILLRLILPALKPLSSCVHFCLVHLVLAFTL